MEKYVIFARDNDPVEKIMVCFYEDNEKQMDLMHRKDITNQLKEWINKGNTGNPPKFYSRINIIRFTSNIRPEQIIYK